MDDLCRLIENCVSKQTISNYEHGVFIPHESFLLILQYALNLPPYYFSMQETKLNGMELRYTGKSSTKKIHKLKTSIQTSLSEYIHLETVLGLNNNYTNPLSSVIISNNNDIEDAVSLLYDEWKLGANSIPCLCSQLEYNGVRIVEEQYDDDSFDGMCGMINHLHQPFIALNEHFTIERRRFTLAHELGHILLNISDKVENKEKTCNYFAGALLLSRPAIEFELGFKRNSLTLEELVSIKERYGISIAAIVHRAYDLRIIDRNYYDHIYDCWINKNKTEKGWGEYKIPDNPKRFGQLKARAISEGIIEGETEKVKITIL